MYTFPCHPSQEFRTAGARLIGITGGAGVGKDTLAAYLSNYGFLSYSLADPIKRGVEAIFGLPRRIWEDRKAKEAIVPWIGTSPRRLAQLLGTEFGRELVDRDIWLKIAGRWWDKTRRTGLGMVVPDVRFDNEAAWIASRGGVVIHVIRPNRPEVAYHSSEAGVSPQLVDVSVVNDSTIPVFLTRAVQCLRAIGAIPGSVQ